MTILRRRQTHFVERSISALNEHSNTLAIAATGFGKTVCLSAVVNKQLHNTDKKACVLAHRDELIFQNQHTFRRFSSNDACPLSTSLINAQEKSWAGQVTFAMVPSLSRDSQLRQMPALDLLVIDEAHHAIASSYVRIVDQAKALNPNVRLYGVTASPMRGDGKGLRPLFSNIADQVKMSEVIRDGHLVPPRTFVVDVGTQEELSQIKQTTQDFDMSAVADIMDKDNINDAVVRHWQEKAGDRKTIVFCSTVNHAHHVCQHFISANINAAVIHGGLSTEERKSLLSEFDHGDLQVLLNCFVLTEGFDSQPVSCVVLLRPSSQQSTYIQCVGRGLRTVDPQRYPGVVKRDCIVLDFGTSTLLHGSLEQAVSLEGLSGGRGDAPKKACPSCKAMLPAATHSCSLCGYVWKSEKEEQDRSEASVDFVMTEVDLLNQSLFQWCDLFSDETAYLATGFDAWAGFFYLNGQWYSVGGLKKVPTKVLAVGEKLVCLAAADDWLNEHETEKAAVKSKRWLHQAATQQQLQFLSKRYRHDHSLTRYHASCLLAFKFNKRDIHSTIFREAGVQAA